MSFPRFMMFAAIRCSRDKSAEGVVYQRQRALAHETLVMLYRGVESPWIVQHVSEAPRIVLRSAPSPFQPSGKHHEMN
jgi:hypothetical protein